MLELGISQAQAQFTRLLDQTVVIVDKRAHIKKAVIVPYEDYNRLVVNAMKKEELETGTFSQFVGILDDDFETTDTKYNEIIQ